MNHRSTPPSARRRSLRWQVLSAIALALPMIAHAQTTDTVAPPRLSCGESLRSLQLDAGETKVVECPRRCTRQPVWGTDIYSADSSICAAAVHQGLVSATSGGIVEVRASGSEQEFAGSERNGVRSQAWGPWPHSFTLAKPADVTPATAEGTSAQSASTTSMHDTTNTPSQRSITVMTERPRRINCATQGQDITGATDDELLLHCPASCSTGSVYGTGNYFDGSAVCRAAIHAGVITEAEGGAFRMKIGGQRHRFSASEQNGVTSRSWGPWTRSFSLSAVGN